MKLSISVCEDLLPGIRHLAKRMGHEIVPEGDVFFEAVQAPGDLFVKKERNRIHISYDRAIHFFRAFSLALEHLEEGNFETRETPQFQTNGIMLDVSREGDTVEAVFERVPIARRHIPEKDIAEARQAIATIQEDPATGIRAMNRSDKQYVLGMAKRLIGFLENTPEIMEVPLQVLKMGDFRLYGFPSEIFSCHGKRLRQGAGFEKKLVCTLANGSFGYVVAEDMFYDTVYESRPGSNRLCAEAGRIMADKLIEMGK